MGRGGRNVTQRPRIVSVVPHVAVFYSTGVEHCSPVRYCLRFRLDFPKDNWLVLGVPMNEAVPEAPSSVESMAKQGCEKLGLEAFDALVRRARTCRRFDESMRVPREFLLELAELAHLTPCAANAQRLRLHVVSGAEDCARVFDELAWAGALKDWPGPAEGERPTGYIAILAGQARRSHYRCRHGHYRADDDARRPQRHARGGSLHVQGLYAPRDRCHGAQ